MSVIQNAVRGLTRTCREARERQRETSARARRRFARRPIRGHEFVETHFCVAERHAKPVVGRVAIEGREAGAQEEPQEIRHAEFRRQRHGGNILRARQRPACEQRAPVFPVVVSRTIENARLRRSENVRARPATPSPDESTLECQRVSEWLQSGSRLPRYDEAVDGAPVRRIEVIARPFPRQPFAGALSSTTTATFAAPCSVNVLRWLWMIPCNPTLERRRVWSEPSAIADSALQPEPSRQSAARKTAMTDAV